MIAIAARSLLNRWFSVGLATLAIALGIALYLVVERTREGAKAGFEATINGVDLIVGARGGDVQILLYSVFNIGNATNNINAESLAHLQTMPGVAWVAPISLGDSHRGYRVVGTTNAFFDNVQTGRNQPLRLQRGNRLEGVFGAVIGASVARELGYGLNQSLVVSHGLVSAGTAEHDNLPFYVAGVLTPTGTPIDRNIYVPIEGITAIHVDWRNGAKIPGRNTTLEDLKDIDLSAKSVTAVLVGVENRLRVFQTQRTINEFDQEPLSAILPGIALDNLWAIMRVAEQSFGFIALATFVVALLGLVALLNMSLAQRRREMAIYRALGARPWQISALLMIEALIIGIVACIVGIVIAIVVQQVVAQFAFAFTNVTLRFQSLGLTELKALSWLLSATVLAGAIPAIRLYRQNLVSGMNVTE